MTITKALSIFGLATLMSVGAVTGVVVSNAQSVEPQSVQAAEEHKITLDVTQYWADDDCAVSVYFFASGDHNGWSSVAYVNAGHHYAEVTYSFNWNPENMIAVRLDPAATAGNWGQRYNQTQNLEIGSHIRITGWDNSAEVDDYATIQGGNQDGTGWGQLATLNSVKKNGSNHCEYYTSVTLNAGQAFKVVYGGEWFSNYSIGDGVDSSDFSGGNGSNIDIHKTGNYIFYFDASTKNVHIANPIYAEADEWAQSFLNNVGCDSSGVNLPTGWNSLATSYAALSAGAKDEIYGATANENGNYIERAVARYDYAISHHSSLTRFITNGAETIARSASILVDTTNMVENNNMALIIVITSIITLASIGGLFLLKKKRA